MFNINPKPTKMKNMNKNCTIIKYELINQNLKFSDSFFNQCIFFHLDFWNRSLKYIIY